MLYFTGKHFDKDFESHMTKEDIRKMIVNIDIISILFTEEKNLNKLGRPAEGKMESTLKRELQELERKSQQRFFPTLNAAVMRICLDLDIAEEELYEYSRQILIYTALSTTTSALESHLVYSTSLHPDTRFLKSVRAKSNMTCC